MRGARLPHFILLSGLAALCSCTTYVTCSSQGDSALRWQDELARARERFAAETLVSYWKETEEPVVPAEAGAVLPQNLAQDIPADLKRLRWRMDVHAKNLLNALTVGYRARRWSAAAVTLSNEQGLLKRTDRDLDLAIDGEGFLRIRLPDQSSIAYTRAGNLGLDAEGRIVTMEGYLVDPTIAVPEGVTRIVIDRDGYFRGFDPMKPDALEDIGQLELTRFNNPAAPEDIGDNLFRETPGCGNRIDAVPGSRDGLGLIRQGFLEQSNVDFEDETLELRRTLKVYRTLRALHREMGK